MNEYNWQYRPRSAVQSLLPPFRGAVKALILACGVVFALQIVLELLGLGGFDAGGRFLQNVGLVPHSVLTRFKLWQPVSYMFLHGGVTHLLFNMLSLWMFGSALEWEWGRRQFLFYYFLTGIGAGLVTVAFQFRSMDPTIGASGAIMALLLAFGVLHPDQPLYVLGVFPVKAKWVVIAVGILTLGASWEASPGGGIAHIAHLGGMAVGYAYLKRVWRVGSLYREIRWRIRRRRFRIIRRDDGNGDPRFPFH